MKKSLSGIRINVFNRNEEISVPLSEKIDSPVVYPIVHNKGKKKINLEELTAEQIEKRKIKRARWGARRLVHEAYVDNFPLLANRFTRERQAAEQKFEYNLGTRAFESIEDADDGMSWLRALFLELDAVVHNFEENDQVTKEEALASIREYLEYELQFWRVQPVRNSPRSNSNSPPPSLSNYQIDTTSHKNVSPDQPVHQDSETKQNDETNIQHNKQSIEIHNFYFNEPGPLGMDLKPCELGISVIRIKPASPADISGIKANDVIIGINQFNTDQIRTRPKEESMALFFSATTFYFVCSTFSCDVSIISRCFRSD
uniref:PDZ domain-containing protein n=1 Tax=Aureoumbra lagunensis TaxID=44058 RepID=A0A7S3NI66_9STRA